MNEKGGGRDMKGVSKIKIRKWKNPKNSEGVHHSTIQPASRFELGTTVVVAVGITSVQ